MEFDFPIQDILQREITCIDGSLTPVGFEEDDQISLGECQQKISVILDKIGQSSGVAQGLQTAVTSSDRLKNTEHRVYLLSDFHAGRNGQVIGLLKMGNKKLYVFDQSGRQNELMPLCVLDFYVHESKQRHGCGKLLYDYMLQAEGVKPGHLAFDRPSDKLLSFLVKHYNLCNIIPQSNNFVVYDSFFDERSGGDDKYNRRVPMDFGNYRPAAGCGTVHRDAKVMSSRRAVVNNRPHSSISKIMDTNGHYSPMNGQESLMMGGDVGDSSASMEHMSPVKSPSHSLPPMSCSAAAVEASELEDAPVRRDIKFQHQRLW
ncbi:hypothetical protein B566_EDAN011957 [Ephemera danica]|nr:hypothetical protein B566_EDAN011957 [Ephemera danica]